jgi:hypothetical protein
MSLVIVGFGLICILVGGIKGRDLSGVWSGIWITAWILISVSLFGVFFLAINALGNAQWHLSIYRIPETLGRLLPVGLLLGCNSLLGMAQILSWTRPEVAAEIGKRSNWLDYSYFLLRIFVYFVGWLLSSRYLLWSLRNIEKDPDPGNYRKVLLAASLFLVFFALSSSLASWDWLMSVDPHWHSTLFGWYVFAGMFVSGLAIMILLVLLSNRSGSQPYLTIEHLHDLGKYLFGMSIFWAYLWYSQYFLIWYGNLPEETVYYLHRRDHYAWIFYLVPVLCFVIPFLGLLSRKAKRSPLMLAIVSVICFIGHWLNIYLVISPEVSGFAGGLGWFETGISLILLMAYIYMAIYLLGRERLPAQVPGLKYSLEYENE